MSNISNIYEEIDTLYELAAALMSKADGLRKKMSHVHAGSSPKRGRNKVPAAVQVNVIEGFRKSITQKAGK